MDHYAYKHTYDHKSRFSSYWHQVYEIIQCAPKTVLEVGIGAKFNINYLGQREISVVGLDIEQTAHPDVVGSVTQLPFSNQSMVFEKYCQLH